MVFNPIPPPFPIHGKGGGSGGYTPVTPREMKDTILALLDEWKEKQPPELGKSDKKKDMEK